MPSENEVIFVAQFRPFMPSVLLLLLQVVVFTCMTCCVHGYALNSMLVELKAQLASKPIRFHQRMMYHQNPKEANREEIESIMALFDMESAQEGCKKESLQLLKGLYLLRVDSALDDAHECVQLLPQADPGVSYAHSLVHKLEGANIGELGLNGYSNCAYWIGQMDATDFPTYNDLVRYACALRKERFGSSQVVCKFVDNDLGNLGTTYRWDPYKFLSLCSNAAKMGETESEVTIFCKLIVQKEWELLADHVMNQCNGINGAFE